MKNHLFLFFFSLFLVSCVQNGTVSSIEQGHHVTTPSCDLSSVDESLTDPQSIEELIHLINSLPKPLTGECLVKSLKRPLYVNASVSKQSAQPATSYSSPRIFIFKGNLIIAVVPTGDGAKLLEFSEMISSTRSIKGEVVLPLGKNLAQTDPFARINYNSRTTCSGCHNSERLESSMNGVSVYSSVAFRPKVSDDVSVDYLRDNHYLCQAQLNTSELCSFMNSLFSNGDVIPKAFPETMTLPQNTFGL